ncbi:TetR family transcriptional regulator [Paenibacillus sp. Soil766]|uniref:TetR/AcrR family transcriptional regulator n=1 Tax=Paenibacillus sp. Soil766 TaxID=1736404 RepID=UPI0007095CA3|nr:TetR/AcrR family transcriptional regulator [Paenibacillus sp. Soil766]KRE97743.1 TetR family transcriptional regulator [Paenibacillus sp. Soil766]
MNKYEIRTNQKKEAIIQSALELFREKGYTSVSINELAAASGVSSVSIYNYFGSKEGLVKECVRILLRETTQAVERLLNEGIGFKEKLMQAVALCTEMPNKRMEHYFSKEAIDDQVFVELFSKSTSEIRMDILGAFIESGREEGAIDASISTETVLEFLQAVGCMQNQWGTASEYRSKVGELYKLMLYGLIGR